MADRRPKKIRILTEEERLLWQKVAETVDQYPSSHTTHLNADIEDWLDRKSTNRPEVSADQNIATQKSGQPVAPFLDPYRPPISTPSAWRPGSDVSTIDEKTARNLLKGRVAIDARIDLHGMTQDEAYSALMSFLIRSQATGARLVLVITGKGKQGSGILKRLVPVWIKEPRMAVYVSGIRKAHVAHGGSGALYLRIRKTR